MLDIKKLRNDYEETAKKLANRGVKQEVLDTFMSLDEKRRKLLVETEKLKKYRNEVSGAIASLKRNKEDADTKIKEAIKINNKLISTYGLTKVKVNYETSKDGVLEWAKNILKI